MLYSSQHGPQSEELRANATGTRIGHGVPAARTILERSAFVEREMIEFSMLLKIFALHRVVSACFYLI